jgi:hypothetical protein
MRFYYFTPTQLYVQIHHTPQIIYTYPPFGRHRLLTNFTITFSLSAVLYVHVIVHRISSVNCASFSQYLSERAMVRRKIVQKYIQNKKNIYISESNCHTRVLFMSSEKKTLKVFFHALLTRW